MAGRDRTSRGGRESGGAGHPLGGAAQAARRPAGESAPRLIVSREAAVEIDEAATWYEVRRAGLGLRFVASLDEAIARILERPASFPALAEPDTTPPVQRAVLRRYPFVVLFVALDHEIRVVALAHQRREPAYWLYRLADS